MQDVCISPYIKVDGIEMQTIIEEASVLKLISTHLIFIMSFVALQCPFAYNCHTGSLGLVGSGIDAELVEEHSVGLCQCHYPVCTYPPMSF